jgi:hypothetical protein
MPVPRPLLLHVLAIAGCVGLADRAWADGPFGITMGSDVAGFDCTELLSPGVYRCRSVPRPRAGVASYTVQYHRSTGICWVKAIGQDFPTDRSGQPVRAAVDQLAQQISQVYGPARKSDYLLPGSSWAGPENWAQSMIQGERFYAYAWDAANLKDHVVHVDVRTNFRDLGTAYAIVEFRFANADKCDEAIRKDIGG